MMEDARTEFKREYTDTIRKSVLAFANTEGGCLYVGIDDGGQVLGVADADDVQKRIVSLCRDGIRPDVMMFLSCDRIMKNYVLGNPLQNSCQKLMVVCCVTKKVLSPFTRDFSIIDSMFWAVMITT